MTFDNDVAAIAGEGLNRWNAGSPLGTPVFVTYSFPTTSASYAVRPRFTSFSEAQKSDVRIALETWSAISGIEFLEVPEAAGGQIRIGLVDLTGTLNSSGAQASGFGYRPLPKEAPFHVDVETRNTGAFDIGGDIFLNVDFYQYNSSAFNPGQRGFSIVQHEIGHAIGFKHPFEETPTIEPAHDNGSYTIMSYNRSTASTTLGTADIAATRLLYGAESLDFSWDPSTLSLIVNGGPEADIVLGTELNDTLNGGDGADLLIGGLGNDRIDGGAGTDTAGYSGARSDHVIAQAGATLTVTGRDGVEILESVERLRFADETLAFDADGTAGQAYRLYQAAFDRTPDTAGLSFWIHALDDGSSLQTVAQGFVGSAEFRAVYGETASNAHIVELFYRHVLGRAGEADGTDYWVGALDNGVALAEVLAGFSESLENQVRVAPAIANGIVLSTEFFV